MVRESTHDANAIYGTGAEANLLQKVRSEQFDDRGQCKSEDGVASDERRVAVANEKNRGVMNK